MEKISRTPPKKPEVVLEVDTKGEDLRGRTCASCACSFLIKAPQIQPIGVTKEQFDKMHDVRVCRLNPPRTVNTPDGPRPFQEPVANDNVCWQWRIPGCIPGEDNHEATWRIAREAGPIPAAPPKEVCKEPRGEALCTLDKGHSSLHYAPDVGHW